MTEGASLPGLCCVLLTSDGLLAARARALCRQRQLPLLGVDTVDAVRGILASIVPSHLVLDARHGEAAALGPLLGGLRPNVRVVHVHGLETGIAALVAICDGA